MLLCIQLSSNLVTRFCLSQGCDCDLFFSGGNLSTHSGYCGVFAEDHQQDSHHNGSRARPNRECMPTLSLSTISSGKKKSVSSYFTIKHKMFKSTLCSKYALLFYIED